VSTPASKQPSLAVGSTGKEPVRTVKDGVRKKDMKIYRPAATKEPKGGKEVSFGTTKTLIISKRPRVAPL